MVLVLVILFFLFSMRFLLRPPPPPLSVHITEVFYTHILNDNSTYACNAYMAIRHSQTPPEYEQTIHVRSNIQNTQSLCSTSLHVCVSHSTARLQFYLESTIAALSAQLCTKFSQGRFEIKKVPRTERSVACMEVRGFALRRVDELKRFGLTHCLLETVAWDPLSRVGKCHLQLHCSLFLWRKRIFDFDFTQLQWVPQSQITHIQLLQHSIPTQWLNNLSSDLAPYNEDVRKTVHSNSPKTELVVWFIVRSSLQPGTNRRIKLYKRLYRS